MTRKSGHRFSEKLMRKANQSAPTFRKSCKLICDNQARH